MGKEVLKHIPANLAKTAMSAVIILPSQVRTDLLSTFDPNQLSTGVRVGLSLGLLALAVKSTTSALEFSHHAEKHEKCLAWTGVALQALASLAIIVDTWR